MTPSTTSSNRAPSSLFDSSRPTSSLPTRSTIAPGRGEFYDGHLRPCGSSTNSPIALLPALAPLPPTPPPRFEVQTTANMVLMTVPRTAPVTSTIPPLPKALTMQQLASVPLHLEQVFDITAIVGYAEEPKSVYTRYVTHSSMSTAPLPQWPQPPLTWPSILPCHLTAMAPITRGLWPSSMRPSVSTAWRSGDPLPSPRW